MSVRPSVRWSVGPLVHWSVGEHESKSGKWCISAPAHPSATGIGRVSGLVLVEMGYDSGVVAHIDDVYLKQLVIY